ncbi:uncharacterized protein LOC131206501 [Anopheles bellator]|uniref:uncharacterized protein LOC131206501 n=1 Tax=Anopheles bellator TaxID=139047 RepID=UPI0026490D8E|nr:uncharacterized protein LOC131206501 [Anopheles bellator]
MNPGSNHDEEIPAHLQKDLLFCEKFTLDRRTCVVYAVTKDCRLLELQRRDINGSVPLGVGFAKATEPTANSLFFDDTSQSQDVDMLVESETMESQKKRHVCVKIYRANDGACRKVFVLVRLDQTLIVVERRPPKEGTGRVAFGSLVVHSRYDELRQFTLVDHPHRLGSCALRIEVHGRDEPIVTDFLSPAQPAGEVDTSFANNFACFDEVLKAVQQQTGERRAQLECFRHSVGQLFNETNHNLKTVPPLLRSYLPEEKVPLVRYGEVWRRIHNDRLVIGVPLYNRTFKRRLALANLALVILNSAPKQMEYTTRFYRLRDDEFDFKSYDEIMAMEDAARGPLNFAQEWTVDKRNVLLAEETAMFVACFELSALFLQAEDVCLKCYVRYTVAPVQSEIAELQLNVGTIAMPRTELYSSQLWIKFNSGELYCDLLAITCTSEYLSLHITYKCEPIAVELRDFFVGRLGFKEMLSTVGGRMVLYCGNGTYWQETLIRLDRLVERRIKLKLYCRYPHQMPTLIQSIYADYEESCSIEVCATGENVTALDLKQHLLKELRTKIEKPADRDEVLQREFCTDMIYCALPRITQNAPNAVASYCPQ